jgi:hypothetical protein
VSSEQNDLSERKEGDAPTASVGNPTWIRGGASPNPKGRPPGPSKQQKLITRMLDEGAEVLDAVLENAKTGDPASASLVLNRILPTLRSQSQTVQFELLCPLRGRWSKCLRPSPLGKCRRTLGSKSQQSSAR